MSYWERDTLGTQYDVILVGAGIVGLSAALSLYRLNPNFKLLILEKEPLSRGTSTRNAGFACFGSPSEILADLENRSPEMVFTTMARHISGLNMLRSQVMDLTMDFKAKWVFGTGNVQRAYPSPGVPQGDHCRANRRNGSGYRISCG